MSSYLCSTTLGGLVLLLALLVCWGGPAAVQRFLVSWSRLPDRDSAPDRPLIPNRQVFSPELVVSRRRAVGVAHCRDGEVAGNRLNQNVEEVCAVKSRRSQFAAYRQAHDFGS